MQPTLPPSKLKIVVARAWRIAPRFLRRSLVWTFSAKFNVGVLAVILNESGEILLLNHVVRSGQTWGLPGGWINKGESIDTAIKRELDEETGLKIEQLGLIHVLPIRRMVEVIVLAKVIGDTTIQPSFEIFEGGFFPRDSLPDIPEKHIAYIDEGLRLTLAGTRN